MMTLYLDNDDLFCHKISMVLKEKDIKINIIDIKKNNKKKDLYKLNPYGKAPTLITKDLIIYEGDIIFEYLEERFPYPPLLSVFPYKRAKARILNKKIDKIWMPILIESINSNNIYIKKRNKIKIIKLLFSLNNILKKRVYILGNEYSIVDCSLTIILYNLKKINIKIPSKNIYLIKYAKKLFIRESFKSIYKYT